MDSFERGVPRTPEPRAGDAGLVLHGALDVIHMLECELEAFPFLSRGLSVLLIPVSCPRVDYGNARHLAHKLQSLTVLIPEQGRIPCFKNHIRHRRPDIYTTDAPPRNQGSLTLLEAAKQRRRQLLRHRRVDYVCLAQSRLSQGLCVWDSGLRVGGC